MRSLVLTIVAGVAGMLAAGAAAQELTKTTRTVRSPDSANVEQPGPDLRYRSGKPVSANVESELGVAQNLRAAQEALKLLDRERTLAAAVGNAVPSGVEDVERQKLVEMRDAWLRRSNRFKLESVCGRTDASTDVELYQGFPPTPGFVQQVQPATGLIRWKVNLERSLPEGVERGEVEGMRWCTGTLIADNLLLTAGHCFDPNLNNFQTPARVIEDKVIPLAAEELAPLMQVEFNYQRDASKCADRAKPLTCGIRKVDVYPITRLLEHRRNKLDYAIVELGAGPNGLPGARYGKLSVDFSDTTLTKVDLLTIVQHPKGAPKRVAAGVHLRIGANSIFYSDVDTMGGSSGAAVLDRNARVIGVHTTGGCDDPTLNNENSGVTLNAISQVSDLIRP
jgi:V8-like Glu-specific endopeptidase